MSMYYRKHGKREHKEYNDGRTKQCFQSSCDINKILQKAQKTGTVSHIAQYQPEYGDFAEFDFLDAQLKLRRGVEIFEAAPSEIRKEFDNNAAKFFAYVNDPANEGEIDRLLPALAEPGRQLLRPGAGRQESEVAPQGASTEGASQRASEPVEATESEPGVAGG